MLLEYTVGNMMLKKMGNETGSKYAGMKVIYCSNTNCDLLSCLVNAES